ncbi:hypothetical protein CAPTEDRAFT_193359 [Capitella teleta]|uniref:Uncharacterized protein n=1 Tax=Capitella teleta TaxID=283909 RepID=R7V312_CAPTE|nr:hypothetical protein CAPTEDRAFT_193359 [Capitella teleta]|eukprot:ELU10056.1 hypothetical protein CAPTEDRAFT_193359 [Capitella teleta]
MGSFSSKDKRTSIRVVQVKETTLEIQGTRLSPKAKKTTKTIKQAGSSREEKHDESEAEASPPEAPMKSVEAELIMKNELESTRRESIEIPNGGIDLNEGCNTDTL